MLAEKLSANGTIGIFCSSHVGDKERYLPWINEIERLGYKVKLGENFCKNTYGYAASAKERAEDFNTLVSDKEVKMILFGGGESAVEVLPFIDYENIKRNPKIISSYSDGTSILNAVYAQTGLVTYYGFAPGVFSNIRHYDYLQFCSNFVEGFEAREFTKVSKWKILHSGICKGTLIGGYLPLFGLMLSNEYFKYDTDKKYLLFVEDCDTFSKVGAVSSYLSFIGQSKFMRNVSGLVFGYYSENVYDELSGCLKRFGDIYNIPVVYTGDFGHGPRHGIFPIGIEGELDADKQRISFYGL